MPKKILIVDDCDQNRLLLKDLLAYHGYEVLTAADGTEGVRMAREHRPDLIIMDIHMPGMNGIEAGRLLRGDPLTREIKLLAFTSSYLSDGDRHFFATGFDGHIDKPINIRQFAETVKQHLAGEGTR